MANPELLAGAYTTDVTPPEGIHAGTWGLHTALAEGAHDRLELSALVIKSGTTLIALVGIDASMIDETATAEARRRITQLTGIPGEAVLINASHDHAGPLPLIGIVASGLEADALEQYTLTLPGRIAGAVYAAYRRLQPARIGFGSGHAPGVSVNRIDRTRPVDDSVWVMRLEALDGKPLALALSFACHPITIGGQTLLWDTDYPGPLRTRIRAELGLADCIFLQGAAGDTAPFDFWFGNSSPRPHSFECRDELAAAVAAAAIEVAHGIELQPELDLAYGSTKLQLPRRVLPWSPEEVRASAATQLYTPEGAYPELWEPDVHTATSAQRFPDYYQHFALVLYQRLIDEGAVPVNAELQAIRLGEHALIATPFEPFREVAARIVAASPFPDTRVLGYSNGYSGYLPPPEDYAKIDGYGLEDILDQHRARWAYGITTAFVGAEASEAVIDASIRRLEELR
jgi:neutral ceramidase